MNILDLMLEREIINPGFTLGRLYVAGMFFGFTCEDTDRLLEIAPEGKVHGSTCIPRGRFRITTSLSQRFGKVLPELHDVPGFTGVRCHGGNTAADTEGCLLVGRVRTATGVASCAERVDSLIKAIETAEDNGAECWITIS